MKINVISLYIRQQSKNGTLEFLHSVLYNPNPKIIAPKTASGTMMNRLDPRPIKACTRQGYKIAPDQASITSVPTDLGS